jgi:hypothetical protein
MMTSCLGGAAEGVGCGPGLDSVALVDNPPTEFHISGPCSCKAMALKGTGRDPKERSDL